jgi:molybdopterin-containing oxidoreductase family iron-sulfur binding subunit
LISPTLAQQQGLANGDLVTLSVEGRSLELPVWIMPGQADGVVVLHLGYGRENAGRIGNGVGFNAGVLRTSQNPWHTSGVQLSATGGTYPLASTQLHHALDTDGVEDRHIIRHGTLAELRAEPEHPHFVHPVVHHESDLYDDFAYPGHAWAMVVDMNVCTGCNACITACQAENNIPIVGKEQVAVGREMQWIRVDAYYGGSIDDPTFYHQPMMCQHCEKAPCEPVCPVAATVHDHEGLNVMVYNRCVGTRYCSNNCPYKVRRFNFLQYAELDETSLTMLANPNVTVRSRGVMEKCTYCVQRIKATTIRVGNENRTLADGEIVTACEAACPTNAIVFGDLNDAESRVAQLRTSVLNYSLLDELNTAPRTTYLAKVTNPHPALAEAPTGAS